ncbi:YlzJ-like family protein [Paenibacillus larvae]|uniref:YlzJ-like family protein n=1 Tax=Paenibacillus larvae TaxID=1464 RepID=UPI0035A63A8D
MNPEDVFRDWDKQKPEYRDVKINGVDMQIETLPEGKAKIVRLYSCNPLDYLDSSLHPGTVISYISLDRKGRE